MNFYDLDPAEQRRASARRLFRYLRDYVYPYHPYLRRLYRKSGLDLDKLRTPDDVRRLPIIDKSHLRSDPQLFILRPTVPGAPPLPEGYETEPLRKSTGLKYALQALLNYPRDASLLVRRETFAERVRKRGLLEWQPMHYHVSTGSTGAPTPVTYTQYEFRRILTELSSQAVLPKHPDGNSLPFEWSVRALNVFPGAPHLAFFSLVLAKALSGLASFEAFGGNVIPTDRQISIFANGGFSSLTAVPSYLVHWLRRATALYQEGKIPALRNLRLALVGAEPMSESLRLYIHELAADVGADPRFTLYQTYGMTETKWAATECTESSGMHLNQKYYYWELLDPRTREPAAPGEPGVLVFSHIGWRGTVLVRYWTGDLVKGGAEWDRCPRCGYTFPRIHPPICRLDKDFTKIKGTLVDLSALVETVRATPGVRLFQICLENETDEFSRDRLKICVAPEPGMPHASIEQALRERVKAATEVSADAIVFEEDEAVLQQRLFARNGIKAEYLVERRAAHA